MLKDRVEACLLGVTNIFSIVLMTSAMLSMGTPYVLSDLLLQYLTGAG